MPMNLLTLLKNKNEDTFGSPPVTIGFLGDSVTAGCFEVLPALTQSGEYTIDVVFDAESAYSIDFKRILNRFYPKAQINIVNAGLSGDSARGGLSRMERDLLPYHPDLTVVCYGLNDCTGEENGLECFCNSLTHIVRKLKRSGSEVILMTPQPICTRVHTQLKGESLRNLAKTLVKYFQEGMFDRYMQQIRDVAKEEDVPLCDVYARWIAMYHSGVDITDLLANYLNHPARDMHWLFAVSLAETVFFSA